MTSSEHNLQKYSHQKLGTGKVVVKIVFCSILDQVGLNPGSRKYLKAATFDDKSTLERVFEMNSVMDIHAKNRNECRG